MRPIPEHMKHLLVDEHHGYPVPYVAEWSSEQDMILPPPEHPFFGAICTTKGGPGQGTPILGAMHPGRQRECMQFRRCQVCHTDLDGDMWMAGGAKLKWFTEPPCCLDCMRFAVQVCPGLVRGSRHRIPGHRLRVRRVKNYAIAQSRVGVIPRHDINVVSISEQFGGISGASSFRVPIDWYAVGKPSMLYFFMGSPIAPEEFIVEDFLRKFS